MASFLDEIVGPNQSQQIPAAVINPSSGSSPPPVQQDFIANNDDESSSDSDKSQNGDGDQDTQDPPNAVTVFTVNTARNLRLTTNGEESLLRFSQVFFPRSPLAHDAHPTL